MANIKITAPAPLYDGMAVLFKAPCACTAVERLAVSYGGVEKVFTFKDAHGNSLTGIGNLFAEGAIVKALLDTVNGFAYLQNADTNAYLEGELAKKAPAGYGLGEAMYSDAIKVTTLTEVDALVKNGWYQFVGDSVQSIEGIQNGAIHVITSRYGVTQEFCVQAQGFLNVVLRRSGYNISTLAGVPWGWVNPPMQLGVEYRTTKRYKGSVVYAQLVDCGAVGVGSASNSTTTYKYGIAPAATEIADYHFIIWKDHENGYKDRYRLPLFNPNAGSLRCFGVCTLAPKGTTQWDGLYAAIISFDDMSTYNAYVYVEYIKD